MKKYLALLIAAFMLAGAFAGCGTQTAPSTSGESEPAADAGETSEPAKTEQKVYDDGYGYNVVRIAWAEDVETNDVQMTTGDYTVASNIMDNLVEIKKTDDGASEIVPALAESWEVSDDGLVYTFHLRQGVKFHNGEILKADDVVYTVERMLDPARMAQGISVMASLVGYDEMLAGTATTCEGVKAIDDNTVQMTLKTPDATFLANMCVPNWAIYNRKNGEEADAAGGGPASSKFGIDAEYTCGTGPFVFKEWVPNDHVYLETFKDYWKGASKLDGVLFRIITDNDTRRMMYENGDLDEFDLDGARELIPDYMASEEYKDQIFTAPRVGVYYYMINENIKPFDDVRVRKAYQMSVDRQTILDTLYAGAGTVANGILAPGMAGYNPNLPEIPYDPEQAKALLAEAGYPDGFDMQLCQETDSPTTLSINELVQAQLAEVGIRAEIVQMDSGTWMDTRRAGELGSFQSSWSADFNDPDNFIYTYFAEETTKGRSCNYYNHEVMKRVLDARSIVDVDARMKEYQDLEIQIIQTDAAWVPLFHLEHVWLFNPRLHGYTPHWAGWSGTCYWSCYLD